MEPTRVGSDYASACTCDIVMQPYVQDTLDSNENNEDLWSRPDPYLLTFGMCYVCWWVHMDVCFEFKCARWCICHP